MREAHLRDAVALSDLLSFLEGEVSRCWSAVGLHTSTSMQPGRTDQTHGCVHMQVAAGRVLDEVEVDAELQKRRGAQAGYLDSSFPTIAGENQPLTPARHSMLCLHGVQSEGLP